MPDQPLWTPSPICTSQSNLTRLMASLNERHGVGLSSYADIHAFSVKRPELFWDAVWEFAGVKASARGSTVFQNADRIWDARFFPDARLNYAENMLAKNDDTPAMIFRGEDKVRQMMSWRMLNDRVARLGQALKAYGIRPGDRVCAVVPNMPDTIAAFLATASVGAVWSSCSPDFGERGILDRFGQIAPRVLIASDGYYYAGKTIRHGDKIAAVLQELPSVEHVIIIDYIGEARAIVADIAQGRDAYAILRAPTGRCTAIRAAALRPSTLYSIFFGHDRHSQMHRASRRRHTSQASHRASASDRPQAGGQAVLLQHLRLDDVELAGERAFGGSDALALRRLALPSQ